MERDELRAIQTPLKERYAESPEAALVTLHADGALGEGVTCSVETGRAVAAAGLHPAAGGDGTLLCSGDMLLEALVACAGVTMRAVATSLGISIDAGRVSAEGDLDFRGTLSVDRDGAGRLPRDPPQLRPRDRRHRGGNREAAGADRALLHGLPDPRDPAPADGRRARRLTADRVSGPLRHLGDLARARARKHSSERDDGQALGELETRPLELPAGLEIEWLGVSGYRLTHEGQTLFIDPFLSRVPFRDILLRRPNLPQRATLDRFLTAPGEVVGVLVGHTHFDHAVDAPEIARRFECKAYGSSSLVRLMALHGLADRAVEVDALPDLRARPVRGQLHAEPALEAAARPRRPLRR